MSNKETFDIVALVQNNPLVRLSNYDNSKIIQKLQDKFNTQDEQFMLANCYGFLNYDPRKDFIINLDRVWKWLGYSRIEECKRCLVKNFIENVDYKIENFAPQIGGAKIESVEYQEINETRGGHNKEYTALTINCFKKLCLKSKTKKADEIHDYYIKLEEVILELITEQSNVLKQQLQIKDIEILTIREKTIIEDYDEKSIVYLGITEENIVKFGFSNGLKTRINTHKREIGSQFKLEYVIETIYNRELEQLIKQKYKDNIISKIYAGKNQTELIQLDKTFNLEKLYKEIIVLRDTFKDGEMIIKLMTENEKLQEKIHLLENTKPIIKDKDQEIITLKNKISHMKKETPFIARHIVTGEEIIFKAYSDAHDIAKIGPHAVKDNYLNKPKQCRGYTFRLQGTPYWSPPENFFFSEDQKASTHMEYCKSVHIETGEIVYYNSITEAAIHMNKLDPNNFPINDTNKRTMTHVISGKKTTKVPLKYYTWSKISNCGYWIHPDGLKEEII